MSPLEFMVKEDCRQAVFSTAWYNTTNHSVRLKHDCRHPLISLTQYMICPIFIVFLLPPTTPVWAVNISKWKIELSLTFCTATKVQEGETDTLANAWCWQGANFSSQFTNCYWVAPFKSHHVRHLELPTWNCLLCHTHTHISSPTPMYVKMQYVNHLCGNGTTVTEILYIQTLISVKKNTF